MYTITIKAPWKRPYSKRDTELYREVIYIKINFSR